MDNPKLIHTEIHQSYRISLKDKHCILKDIRYVLNSLSVRHSMSLSNRIIVSFCCHYLIA
jgi:hypothetical protein